MNSTLLSVVWIREAKQGTGTEPTNTSLYKAVLTYLRKSESTTLITVAHIRRSAPNFATI